jgi:hypothetical protein
MDPYVPQLVYRVLLPLTALATKELTKEELRAVTALGLIDLLKGGSTTTLDLWHHGQEVFFDIAKEVGIRVVGAPFILSQSNSRMGPDGYPVWDFGNDGMAQLKRSMDLFKARDEGREGLVQVAIGPHATDTCLPELLRECRKAADDLGCVLTTHFAQTPQEVALLRKLYDKGPAEYARDTGLLGRNVVLAHAGCTTDDDLKVLAAAGNHVANCAVSFVREGVNFPYARFANAGINTGIGTDSHGMDLISEMRTTGYLSKHYFGKAHVGTAHQLIRAATLAGAKRSGAPTWAGWRRRQGGPACVRPLQAPSATGVGSGQEPDLERPCGRHRFFHGPRRAGDARRQAAPARRGGRHAHGCRGRPQDLADRCGAENPAAARCDALTERLSRQEKAVKLQAVSDGNGLRPIFCLWRAR